MNRVLLVACMLGGVSCLLSSCHQDSAPPGKVYWAQKHRLEIVDPHGAGAWLKYYHEGSGPQGFIYESDRTSIKLEDEVLTVNGKTYILPKKEDAVRIEGGSVAINGQPAIPEEK